VPRTIDGREMQPPQPLEATLAALDELAAGEELLLLLYCQPQPLYQVLKRNGYAWTETLRGDGTVEVRIRATR
jgi:uncharacterized protein (DUF2249 family)